MPKRYTPNDKWSRKAREEGFRARSVFKLEELDRKFHLVRPGMTVLDLGAAPGSWLQYVSQKIGPHGRAIGLDLQDIPRIAENVWTKKQDLTDINGVLETLRGLLAPNGDGGSVHPSIDLVLSDAAPSTSGIHDVDQWRSIELNRSALAIAKRVLQPGGTCVLKVFRGADFEEFLRDVKAEWKNVVTTKAAVSRDRSTEIYVLCRK